MSKAETELLKWLQIKKAEALQDAKEYNLRCDFTMHRACEYKAVAFSQVIDRLTRKLTK